MNWLEILPQLWPLLPDIKAAIATAERLQADQDIKDALATAEKVTTILQQEQSRHAESDDLKFQVEQLKKTIVEKDIKINQIKYVIGEVIGFLKPMTYRPDYKPDIGMLINKLKSL